MSINLEGIQNTINDRRRDRGSNSVNMNHEGFRAVNGTLQMWNQLHDWEWQIDKSLVNYNEGIDTYSIPAAYKGPIDIRPYKPSRSSSEFSWVSPSNFHSETLKTKRATVETIAQVEYLKVKYPGNKATLNTLGQSDGTDGTYTRSGAVTANTISSDSYESFDNNSSVKFDYSGTSGIVEINFATPIDVSQYEGRSSIYWNTNFSSYTNWTNMSLRIGHDLDNNYWTATVTSDYLSQTPTSNQWNRHKILWTDMTSVGTPSAAIIGSARLTIVFSSNPSLSDARIENLFISENIPLQFEYYTNNMVVAQSGSAKTQGFTSSANVMDQPLWGSGTGKYDWVTESFVDSTLETVFWMTGEITDYQIAQAKVSKVVDVLKKKIPSRRRYAEMGMKFSIN